MTLRVSLSSDDHRHRLSSVKKKHPVSFAEMGKTKPSEPPATTGCAMQAPSFSLRRPQVRNTTLYHEQERRSVRHAQYTAVHDRCPRTLDHPVTHPTIVQLEAWPSQACSNPTSSEDRPKGRQSEMYLQAPPLASTKQFLQQNQKYK